MWCLSPHFLASLKDSRIWRASGFHVWREFPKYWKELEEATLGVDDNRDLERCRDLGRDVRLRDSRFQSVAGIFMLKLI